jgi:hypothetical protein
MEGTNRCDFHGGKSPQVIAKAAERRALARAQRTLEALGGNVEPVKDPFAALEKLAGEAVTLTEILREEVSKLRQIRYESAHGGEQLRAEISGYLAAMARAESILGRILSLDLDARRLQLEEAQAQEVIAALTKALQDRALNLDTAQQQRARALIARELGVPPVIEASAEDDDEED